MGRCDWCQARLQRLKVSAGRITRTGNAQATAVGETADHQHRPSVGAALTRRRKAQPGRVIAIADKAAAAVSALSEIGGGT